MHFVTFLVGCCSHHLLYWSRNVCRHVFKPRKLWLYVSGHLDVLRKSVFWNVHLPSVFFLYPELGVWQMLRNTTWHSGYTGSKMKANATLPWGWGNVRHHRPFTMCSISLKKGWKHEKVSEFDMEYVDWSLSNVEILRQLQQKQFSLEISLNVSWELGCTLWFCPCLMITHDHVALFIVHQNSSYQSNV